MLAAYLPLEMVYAFHETAETWILQRTPAAVAIADGAERTRAVPPSSTPIAVFRDRSSKSTVNADSGQQGPATQTVYTRTRLVTTDDQRAGGSQPSDVLINPADGSMWQAVGSGDWDEAKGYAVTIQRCGSVGTRPWA